MTDAQIGLNAFKLYFRDNILRDAETGVIYKTRFLDFDNNEAGFIMETANGQPLEPTLTDVVFSVVENDFRIAFGGVLYSMKVDKHQVFLVPIGSPERKLLLQVV